MSWYRFLGLMDLIDCSVEHFFVSLTYFHGKRSFGAKLVSILIYYISGLVD